jgi:hypothetical protein
MRIGCPRMAGVAIAFALPQVALATTAPTTHNPRLAPTVLGVTLSNPEFDGEPNTMIVTATVRVNDTVNNAVHDAVVGHVLDSDYVACDASTPWNFSSEVKRFKGPTDTLDFSLYNFVPDQAYRYVVRTGFNGRNYRYSCGTLPTPTLPDAVAALNWQYEAAGASHPFSTRYVLTNGDDCSATGMTGADGRAQMFVLDTLNETIVWYLDLVDMTGLRAPDVTGWRYQPATATAPEHMLVLIDKRYLYEWGFDGTLLKVRDFSASGTGDECDGTAGAAGPCVHHDVTESPWSGKTYVVSTEKSGVDGLGTDWEACGPGSEFINDGFQAMDATLTTTSSFSLMGDYDYDPTVDGGPNARPVTAGASACHADTWGNYLGGDSIDWTHTNSLSVSLDGTTEVLDMSIHGWDQIIRLNASTGAFVWSLAADDTYSSLGRVRIDSGIDGRATFAGQHDVHMVGPDSMMMLDNRGDDVSRVLRIDLSAAMPTIDRSWAIVDAAGDPLECPVEGGGQEVPGTSGDNVLAACQEPYSIVELDDATGYTTTSTIDPPLVISLPDGSSEPYCTVGGPDERRFIRPFYRAYPMTGVGSFH